MLDVLQRLCEYCVTGSSFDYNADYSVCLILLRWLLSLAAEATFRKCILEQAPDLLNSLATNAVTNTGVNIDKMEMAFYCQ